MLLILQRFCSRTGQGSKPRKYRITKICTDNDAVDNNNSKQICIVPLGRNFRGAGARQHISEQRKKRNPGKRGMSLA